MLAYTNVQEQNVKFLKKRTLKWFRSSKRAKRGFCRKCGASLFFKIIGSNNISITPGMDSMEQLSVLIFIPYHLLKEC